MSSTLDGGKKEKEFTTADNRGIWVRGHIEYHKKQGGEREAAS
jgi:hypothetical protein